MSNVPSLPGCQRNQKGILQTAHRQLSADIKMKNYKIKIQLTLIGFEAILEKVLKIMSEIYRISVNDYRV